MKKSALTLLFMIAAIGSATADDCIKQNMKKYHKAPEGTDPMCKKVSNGAASDAELGELLKAYQAICGATPPQGEKTAWVEKCQTLIGAVKKIQAKDAAGVSDYKKAVNCKACHEVFKPKA